MPAPGGGGVKVGTGVVISVGLSSGVSVGAGEAVQVANGVDEGVKVGMEVGIMVSWGSDVMGVPADVLAVGPWSSALPGSVATAVIAGIGESTAMALGTGVFVGVGVMLIS
jgi:hypothetical protein